MKQSVIAVCVVLVVAGMVCCSDARAAEAPTVDQLLAAVKWPEVSEYPFIRNTDLRSFTDAVCGPGFKRLGSGKLALRAVTNLGPAACRYADIHFLKKNAKGSVWIRLELFEYDSAEAARRGMLNYVVGTFAGGAPPVYKRSKLGDAVFMRLLPPDERQKDFDAIIFFNNIALYVRGSSEGEEVVSADETLGRIDRWFRAPKADQLPGPGRKIKALALGLKAKGPVRAKVAYELVSLPKSPSGSKDSRRL